MIDPVHYRRSETLARQFAQTWRVEQAHHPHIFTYTGQPIRVESISDLRQLVDTMQEGRFDAYMRELGGLSEERLEELVKALTSWAHWFSRTFDIKTFSLPMSTMIAHQAIYHKVSGVRHEDILEIGPGCGYLSFFLCQEPDLRSYTQIETCESFYLLQALVNDHCFPGRTAQHAAIDSEPFTDPPTGECVTIASDPICHQIPWWQLDLANYMRQFDVVTSNANITEFTETALVQYLKMIKDRLKPDGVLVVQCYGAGTLEPKKCMDLIDKAGLQFATVDKARLSHYRSPVENGLFTHKGNRADYSRVFWRPDGKPRKSYTQAEIVERVRERLT